MRNPWKNENSNPKSMMVFQKIMKIKFFATKLIKTNKIKLKMPNCINYPPDSQNFHNKSSFSKEEAVLI